MFKLIYYIYYQLYYIHIYLKYYLNLLLVIAEINYQVQYWDAVERNKFSLLHLYQLNKDESEKKNEKN